jgi:hypothetical protein
VRDRSQPSRKLHALRYGNRIELIPIRPLAEARGFLPGLDTTVEREPDRLWTVAVGPPDPPSSPGYRLKPGD